MNKIFNKWVLAAALVCSSLTYLSAQPTREQLAQIRVDKEGNFKYWNGDAAALAQLKAFVAAVTTEGSEQYVPVRDRLAVFDMDGTLLCETAPFYMNWLVMLHRLRDDWTTIYGPDVRPTATAVRSVSRVAESHGRAYTIGGQPATDQTQDIVISDQKKTVRR